MLAQAIHQKSRSHPCNAAKQTALYENIIEKLIKTKTK